VFSGSHTESSHLIGHWKLGATNRAALAALFSANNLLKCICVDRWQQRLSRIFATTW